MAAPGEAAHLRVLQAEVDRLQVRQGTLRDRAAVLQ